MAARGTGLGVQYEDFVPKSEWKDQPEATLLTIDLPGFTKEQLKVTFVQTSKMLRVTGERPLAGRRWSRFNEVFTVPQNCLVNKLHGSFNNNTLTITMPKETITKMPNLPEASKTDAEKRLLEESRRKAKEEEAEKKKKLLEEKEGILRKLQEQAKANEMAEARRLQEEAKAKERAEARRLREEAKAKEMAEARRLQEEAKAKEMAKARRLQEEAKAKEMAKARRLQEAAKAKEMAEARRLQEEAIAKERVEARRLQEEAIAKERAEARRLQEEAIAKEKAEARKLQEEAIAKEKLLEEAALEKKIQEKKSMDEYVRKEKMLMSEDMKLQELDYTKSVAGSRTTKPVSGGASEAVKSAEEKLSYLAVKEKKTVKGIMGKIRGRDMTSEEKKMMVNVGVSALVIFALGAYVSYSFCSSSSSTKPE